MNSRKLLWLPALALIAVLMLVLAASCGDDDGDDGGAESTRQTGSTATSRPSATQAPMKTVDNGGGGDDDRQGEGDGGDDRDGGAGDAEPAPGRIIVTSSPISGHKSELLLVFGPASTSEICAMIEGDTWSLPETPLTDRDPDSDPCSDRGAESLFEPGEYFLTASVVVPGEQSAGATTAVPVKVVDGDARVEIDGSELSGKAQAGDPGRILVTSSEITGQQGRLLVVVAQGNAGSACVVIDADPWTLPDPVAMTELPGGDSGPCGEHTPDVTFPAGENVVTASIYVPGETQARATTQVFVTVDGDVTAAVNGSALSAP